MAVSKIVYSAQLLCFINGRLVGETTGIRWDAGTPHIERRCLDSLTPYALEPSGAKVSGTISLFRIRGIGGLEGRGITAPFTHTPLQKYFSLLLVDRATGKKMFQSDFCVVTAQNWGASARGRVEGQFSFDAIEWTNEAEYS